MASRYARHYRVVRHQAQRLVGLRASPARPNPSLLSPAHDSTSVLEKRIAMKNLPIPGLAAAAAIALAPLAHAGPNQGDQCMDWHATMTGPNGQTMTCTHLPQSDPSGGSGHIMYWEYGGARDTAYRTTPSGQKPHQPPFPPPPGGPPCNENDGIVTHVSSGGNAIEDWGPAGCDNSKPMIDGPHH